MTEQILTKCPFCGKPHTVSLSMFDSVAISSPALQNQNEALDPRSRGFWPSFWSSDLGLALGLGVFAWGFTWFYGYSPLWSIGVTFLAGFGIPILRVVVNREIDVSDKPDRVLVSVQVDERTPGGFSRSLDDFNGDLVTFDDLAKLAAADSFSRSSACKAGLSQDKWHKVKDEFLRLNFAVNLPNGQNGYALTLRGSRLLAKIRERQQTTTNNKG